MERLYLTYTEDGRHIQYADINEDNYVCNVESNDSDAKEIVHRCNVYDQLVSALEEVQDGLGSNKYEGIEDILRNIIENALILVKEK